jgi:CRISPR-associated RAMP protein (TIGR02581 family)
MNDRHTLERKITIKGRLAFDTAFHIGSGREGEMATDMGVLLEQGSGRPILPGSSLKGKFRATAERLAGYLGLSACLLDTGLSGVKCVTDEAYRQLKHDDFRTMKNDQDKLNWLAGNVCGVCALFGSPLHASRIYFSDGRLEDWSGAVEIRDGVSLDRDSETARDGLKFDFEVVPAGAAFALQIDLENPSQTELALVGAVLAEWNHGVRLGGKTSRGLGLARLDSLDLSQVDYTDPDQRLAFFLERKMTPVPKLFDDALGAVLRSQGGENA